MATKRSPRDARAPEAVAAVGLAALAVAMGIGRFAFTPLLPMMQKDAGLSLAAGAWLASANYAGYLLGALLTMVWRIPPAIAIRAGLAAIVVATLGMGVTEHFAAWVALRGAAGIASAWILVYVSSWCLETLTPLRRPVLIGSVFSGVGVGIAAAGVLCLGLILAKATSAQTWIALGLISLVASLAIWPALAPRDRANESGQRAPAVGGRVWSSEWLRLTICYGVFGFGYIIPATFIPAMAREIVQKGTLFGWAWPVFGTAAAVSTLAVAALLRRVHNRALWIASQLAMAVGVSLPVVWPGIAGLLLAALLVGGTFMVITMTGMREAREVAGPHAPPLMAAMTSAFAVGQIAGPLAVSMLSASWGGYSRALLLASILLAASAFILSRGFAARAPDTSPPRSSGAPYP
jgi:predicted MFS family arabinose efflux permease